MNRYSPICRPLNIIFNVVKRQVIDWLKNWWKISVNEVNFWKKKEKGKKKSNMIRRTIPLIAIDFRISQPWFIESYLAH